MKKTRVNLPEAAMAEIAAFYGVERAEDMCVEVLETSDSLYFIGHVTEKICNEIICFEGSFDLADLEFVEVENYGNMRRAIYRKI